MGAWYTKCMRDSAKSTPLVLMPTKTRRFFAPPRAGDMHWAVLKDTNVAGTALSPKRHKVRPDAKFSPSTVTSEPPLVGPPAGATDTK